MTLPSTRCRADSDVRRVERYRKNYLPEQLAATRHKLAALRNEARRLGMHELIAADDEAQRQMILSETVRHQS